MPGSLKVVIVASEVVPFAKTGGLADVAGALPVALARLGHQVSVIMPRYPTIERAVRSLEKVQDRRGGDLERKAHLPNPSLLH